MPRKVNLEKYKDFMILHVKAKIKAQRCSEILEVGTSTLSRWKDEFKPTEIEALAEKSDEEVFNTKIKYAIKLIFKGRTLRDIKGLCTAFETNQLSGPYYKRIAAKANIVDLDVRELFNALSQRAQQVITTGRGV